MLKLLILNLCLSLPAMSSELIIASHNLAMKNDSPLIISMNKSLSLRKISPDLLFVQEVVSNTAELLEHHLKMNGQFAPRPWDNEAVGVLTKFPIVYKENLTIKSRADNGFTRTASMIEFNHPTLSLIRAIGVHFAYRLEHHYIRTRQMSEVRSWMDKREKLRPAAHIFIGGDFNATIDEELFNYLQDFQNPNSKMSTYIPSLKRIDYIFWKTKKINKSFLEIFPFPDGIVAGKQLSDHRTLMYLF